MARYTGPVCKLCRREGLKLFLKGDRCFTPKCAIERRNQPPGQHGQRRRGKVSDYGLQLREKQKARRTYGIMERQFKRHFEMAEGRPGVTGENLLQVLETRLDNVVYRLGFANSRPQARQLVSHGHFLVNGVKTDIPSYICKATDVIAVRPEHATDEYFKVVAAEIGRKDIPTWLTLDPRNLSGTVISLPARADLDVNLNEQLIVEFYSR
ncbi:MAG TPA: 30S ribosomal protein S4 [Chloroflexia bacterium]|jgi:small subunit ribosomal protein S4|nr:30S ribosomal protein S4 [Chloroflexia bacterium]